MEIHEFRWHRKWRTKRAMRSSPIFILNYGHSYIDECAEDLRSCNKDNTICSNTVGSFKCFFEPGFIRDGHSCRGKILYNEHWKLGASVAFWLWSAPLSSSSWGSERVAWHSPRSFSLSFFLVIRYWNLQRHKLWSLAIKLPAFQISNFWDQIPRWKFKRLELMGSVLAWARKAPWMVKKLSGKNFKHVRTFNRTKSMIRERTKRTLIRQLTQNWGYLLYNPAFHDVFTNLGESGSHGPTTSNSSYASKTR